MSNCNPHLFGGDHHCGSCGRSAEDIVTELEAEVVELRSRLALDELLEERQDEHHQWNPPINAE